MTQFYFLILSVIVFLIIRSIVRNTNDFYSYFLIYLSFSILGQYFITDITGAQWFLVTHDKVIFEYIGFSLLIFRFGASQYNKSRKELSNINLYSFIFVLLSAIFILFSINMEASIILVVISVLGPLLLGIEILNNRNKIKYGELERIFSYWAITFMSLGVILIIWYIMTKGVWSPENRTVGSLYFGNFTIFVITLVFPVFILSKNITLKVKYLFFSLIFFNIFFSLSRAGLIIYTFFFILIIIHRKKSSIKYILFFLILLLYVSMNVNNFFDFDIDLLQLFETRFYGYEQSVYDQFVSDERFEIWRAIYKEINNEPQRFFYGVGLGNFRESDSRELVYSNAHNLILNMVYERGIFVFSAFVAIIFSFIRFYWKQKRTNIKRYQAMVPFVWGIIMFLTIAMFYEDIRTISGFVTGLPAYLLFFTIFGSLKVSNEVLTNV